MSHRSYNFDTLGVENSRSSVSRSANAAFRASISGFTVADEGHMMYEITVEDRRFSDRLLLTSAQAPVWTVRRRFSEFFSFKTALTERFPQVEALYFPRRKIFSSGTDPHVVQARRIVLDGWLQQLLSDEAVSGSPLVLDFLQAAASPPPALPANVNFAHSWRAEQGMTEMSQCPGVWWVCFSTHSISAPAVIADDDALSFHSMGSPKSSSTPPPRELPAAAPAIALPPPKLAPAAKSSAAGSSSDDLQRSIMKSSRSFASLMSAPSHSFVIDSHLILLSDRDTCTGIPFRTLVSHELWHFYRGCSLKVAVLLSGGGLRFIMFGSKIDQGNVCQLHAEKGDCIAVLPVESGGSFFSITSWSLRHATSASTRFSNTYVGPRTSTPAHFAGGATCSIPRAMPLDDVAEDETAAASVTQELLWEFDDSDDVRSRHPEHIDVISQVYSSL